MHQISCANLDTPGSVLSSLFTHFLTSILTRQCEFGNVAYPADRTNDVLDNHVPIDMIVVGSGSSGSVMANRLSEVTKWNVLLIEAGGDPSVSSHVPGLTFTQYDSSMDWAYQTEKQPGVCEGLQNGVCNVPRGKALGGTSNLNAMMYLVGNPNDYNSWGHSDWNFTNVEKYFHKSYDDYYFAGFASDPISYNKTELTELVTNAGKELNLHKLKYKNKNINPNKVGVLHIKTNIKDGERLNTARAFLAPIKDRPNLLVMKNTFVTKILIDNKKATGVQIYKDEKYYEIKFNKELIISAGAVNTPQLLFQSGIGNEELLMKENIDVKVNLPSVGNYLYDHPLFVFPVQMSQHHGRRKNSKNLALTEANIDEHADHTVHTRSAGSKKLHHKNDNSDEMKHLDEFYSYVTKRTGSMAGIGIVDYVTYLDTTGKNPDEPNIELVPFFYPKHSRTELETTLNYFNWPKTLSDPMYEALKDNGIFLFIPMLLKPKSYGNITLSKGVFSRPKIYFNYFDKDEDLDTYLQTIRIIQKFLSTKAFRKQSAKFVKLPDPMCDKLTFDSDEYWKCSFRRRASSYYHLSSTARMGDNTLSSVVNYKLQVHGLENVRVADASVMPYTVGANIHATCVMIAEKCADLIKQDWKESL